MILYKGTKAEFNDDVLTNNIGGIVYRQYRRVTGQSVAESEVQSWQNSLMYMNNVLTDDAIPDDAGVCIEFHIPRSSKRIDFLLSGKDEYGNENVILVELKQWSFAERTDMDGIVRTWFKHGLAEVSHPSYQAWSYASLLNSFNSTVYEEDISLRPCVYCHNYEPDDVLNHPFYSHHFRKAPLFLKPDSFRLRDFIKKYVKYGDDSDMIFRIENGKIKPSKSLADSLESMLKGNEAFVMIDDQKVVFEKARALASRADSNNKHVLIVEGGPGTGKSVVAVNLLVAMTGKEMVAQYVTKNAAPRAVYEKKLVGSFRKTAISNLFSGAGSFVNSDVASFDALIVDEAHRLNEHSGLFRNLGENQIKEIIHAANFTVFFLDEDQRVTFLDIGERAEIERWARREDAVVHHLTLSSQFRCNGSAGYLAWLDNTLQVRETATGFMSAEEFDIRVLDSPSELRDLIFAKNAFDNKARMVAGYCWDWTSKKDATQADIVFEEFGFAHKWNLSKDGGLWIISPDSVNEIGCIHTCQGLELDYVGVIIGPDLKVRDGEVITDASERSSQDRSIWGYKKMLREDPDRALALADLVIKNTYKTLLSRGMKGCYVYCTDEETAQYVRSRIRS